MILARTRTNAIFRNQFPNIGFMWTNQETSNNMLASRSCTHVLLQANVMQVRRAQHTLRITNHDYLHLMGLVDIFAREEKRRKHTS